MKLGQGVAYAAPVIYTLSRPKDLHAIFVSGMLAMSHRTSDDFDMGSNMSPWGSDSMTQAPWNTDPPWASPPSTPAAQPETGSSKKD